MTIQYTPDLELIRAKARATWEKRQKRQMGIQERIGASVPWWLIIIALAFFLLSAPHTALLFSRLSPVFGVLAPLAIEFSLLYAAFMRRGEHAIGNSVRSLEVLAFVVSMGVNAAGSLTAVVASDGLSGLSTAELIARFGNLSATDQAALVLVPFFALIVPIGAEVAGHGMAKLILERRKSGNWLEQIWAVEQQGVMYEALFADLIRAGYTAAKARQSAAAMSQTPELTTFKALNILRETGSFDRLSVSTETTETKQLESAVSDTAENVKTAENDLKTIENKLSPVSPAMKTAIDWFTANPERLKDDHRLLPDEIGVSASSIYRAQKYLRDEKQ